MSVMYIRNEQTGEFEPVPSLVGPQGPPGANGGGAGTVTSVNKVAPDANGNVTLTATNVGALSSGGTAVNATQLNGKSADQYMLKTDTAADSAKLGGVAASEYTTKSAVKSEVVEAVEERIAQITESDAANMAEVISARTDEDGVAHVSLKTRIDSGISQLKDTIATEKSVYRRELNYGNIPDGYYKWRSAAHNIDTSMASSAFLGAFDAAVLEDGYCDDINLGNSSAVGKAIYAYDFNPPQVEFAKAKPIPHIIITCAQHGTEKGAAYGLFYFLQDVVKNWRGDPLLTYLRHHVRFTVIPICNRYGWDNNLYYNANGVNLNRNFGYAWEEIEASTGTAGAEAFDQPETQIIRDLIAQYPDALAVIDVHTSSRLPATAWVNTNLIDFCNTGDIVYERLYSAVISHYADIKAHFIDDYALEDTVNSTQFGYTSTAEPYGGCDWWACSKGIAGMTFEGFAGFVGDEKPYSVDVMHANAELIGNWILSVLRTFSR